MVLLLICYLITIFAVFFSPYSPTNAEFREFFFHPPTPLHFRDQNGNFHLRPTVSRTFLLDRARIIYASAAPLQIYYRRSDANQNPYFNDTLESDQPILKITDDKGKLLAEIFALQETDRNSAIFTATVPIETKSKILTAVSVDGKRITFPIVFQIPKPVAHPLSPDLFLMDSAGKYIGSYYPEQDDSPVHFF